MGKVAPVFFRRSVFGQPFLKEAGIAGRPQLNHEWGSPSVVVTDRSKEVLEVAAKHKWEATADMMWLSSG